MAEGFKVIVDDQHEFYITDDSPDDWDIISLNGKTRHVIHQAQSYNCEIQQIPDRSKEFRVDVDGRIYHVIIMSPLDQKIDSMGLSDDEAASEKEIFAPMPGMVLDIKVAVGQTVDKGEDLLVLEAMKMENLLKAASDGEIEEIHCNTGDAVDKHQLLITIK